MEQMTMGKRISALRKKVGLTQDTLARNLGVSPQAVSKWENDLSCPDIGLLPKLAKILGVSTDVLLGAEEETAPVPAEEHTEELPPEEPDRENDPEDPEEKPPVIQVESADGNFDVHINPPGGAGLWTALWVILTGVLMLAGPALGVEPVGFWMSVLLSGVMVFSLGSMRKRINFFNFTVFACGVFITLSKLSLIGIELDWDLVLPGMIVLFGLFLLLDVFRKRNRAIHISGPDKTVSSKILMTDGYLCYHNAFGEDHYRVATPVLTGGEINVSFGEHVLDFSGVEAVSEDCTLDVNSAFGEISLLIPKRYRADVTLSKSFADADIYGTPDPEPQGTIAIEASLSFGELTIRYI